MTRVMRSATKCSWGSDRGGCPGTAELEDGMVAVIGAVPSADLQADLADLIGEGEGAVVLKRDILQRALLYSEPPLPAEAPAIGTFTWIEDDEVTPAMIESGVEALLQAPQMISESAAHDAVKAVYAAMRSVAPHGKGCTGCCGQVKEA
jgi:hypothetical protein